MLLHRRSELKQNPNGSEGWQMEDILKVSNEAVASQRIANSLRRSIIDGTLPPGTRIMQEEIAAQFGASRLPVREAFRILESEGLVLLRANSGAWVSKIELSECIEIYKIREKLEPLALQESVVGLGDTEIDKIESLCQAIEGTADIDVFLRLDREFHLLTYRGCKMRSLMTMVERFWNTTQHYRRAYASLLGLEKRWIIDCEHRLLVDAIRRRDVDEGGRILHGHIRRTRLALEQHENLFRS